MKKVFMIFAKESIENGIWEAYSDRKFRTKEAAESYIKDVLEPYDKECGVYEPNYYCVEDMSEFYN